jgi:hypothetical protein
MTLKKIVSGGQTGVDRAALDAALSASFPCGGRVTWDRMAEGGIIPERYPLVPLPIAFATRMGQRTPVREASQSHASNSPMPGEHKDMRTARPDGE